MSREYTENNRKRPELLAPAGSLPVLKIAVLYGADAVYLGGEAFSLRANAHNFTFEEMKEGIRFAHEHGTKVFVTANIYAHNRDLEEAETYFRQLKEIAPDAILISDPGLFSMAKRIPETGASETAVKNNAIQKLERFEELNHRDALSGKA